MLEPKDRILVTGAGGLVGSHVADLLREQGFDPVIGLLRQDRARRDTWGGIDLLDFQQCRQVMRDAKPQHVFHAAARVYGIGGNMANPAQSFYENVTINTNVIEAARQYGVRKITVMGTGAVYPLWPQQANGIAHLYKEDEIFLGRPHPSEAAYAHAKRAMLAQLEAYGYDMEWAYIVSCNLFGPRDKFDSETGHVVPSLIAKFHAAKQKSEPVCVWGNGSAERDFLYVADAARVATAVMDRHWGPINMGSGRVYSIRRIVNTLCSISGHYSVEWDETKPNGQALRGYDLSLLHALGFKPEWSIERGLAATWEWYCNEHQ